MLCTRFVAIGVNRTRLTRLVVVMTIRARPVTHEKFRLGTFTRDVNEQSNDGPFRQLAVGEDGYMVAPNGDFKLSVRENTSDLKLVRIRAVITQLVTLRRMDVQALLNECCLKGRQDL